MNASVTASNHSILKAGLIIIMVISSSFLWAQDRAKIEKWSVEVDTLMNRQDFEGALKLLNKIITESKLKTDDDYIALYNRALSYFSLNRYDEALKDVNQYIAKFPEQHALMLRLYIYQEKGDSESQMKDLDKLIAENPQNPELLQWRISAMMDAGRYDVARRDIRTLMEMGTSPELTLYLGFTYYYEDKADSALAIFDQVIKESPGSRDGYLYAGSMCIEKEAYDMGLTYINRGLEKFPSDNQLLFYKGLALVESERTQEGCRCLTKALHAGFDDAVDYLKQYCYGIDK